MVIVSTRVTEPSNIRWFEKFDIRSSNIESSNHSRIFDHRTGSIIERFDQSNISIFDQGFDIRYSMVRRIEYLKNSKRFVIGGGSIDRLNIPRVRKGSIFDNIRYSNTEYRISNFEYSSNGSVTLCERSHIALFCNLDICNLYVVLVPARNSD